MELIDIDKLPPESEDGNCEYKRFFEGENKFAGYKTQLNRRLQQGHEDSGIEEAIYFIGFEDDGKISGMNIKIINQSIDYLNRMAKDCDAVITDKRIEFHKKGVIAICTVQRCHKKNLPEYRILFLGDTNSGKTTFVSSLTHFKKDDGYGKSRLNSMKHSHEMKSGNTSSITPHIYGYTDEKKIISYGNISFRSWNIIAKKSSKLVTIIDTPGNEKFIRTTLHGICSLFPDMICYFMDVKDCFFNKNLNKIKSNIYIINLLIRYGLKVVIILTKSDLVKTELAYPKIEKILNLTLLKNVQLFENEIDPTDDKIPLLFISNISHFGINLYHDLILRQKFNNFDEIPSASNNFLINDFDIIPDIGIILHGILIDGRVNVGDKLMIGPIKNSYEEIIVKTIHKKQVPRSYVTKGEYGSLQISINEKSSLSTTINKTLSVISDDLLTSFYKKFNVSIAKEDCVELFELYKSTGVHIFFNNIIEIIHMHDDIEFVDKFVKINCRFRNKKTYHLITGTEKGFIKIGKKIFFCFIDIIN